MNSFRVFSVAVLLALACPAMHGHDPYDITSQARLLPEGIELRLTLASSTARRLLNGKPAPIQPGQFDALRSEFERRAPQFLTLTAGNKTLVPKSVTAEFTVDGDVKILLQYPPSTASRLRFDAALLRTLATDGYTVLLLVRGPHEDQAVHERLTLEKPQCEISAFSRPEKP
jgi:hypothetical protein